MPLTDDELDLIEEYLDGALPPGEAESVERRVGDDPAWAAAAADLRADRATRAKAFAALEPSVDASHALAAKILNVASARRRYRSTALRLGRVFGAIAACVALSFGLGWLSRGKTAAPQTAGVPGTNVATPVVGAGYQVTLTDGQGRVIGIQKFGSLEQATEFAHDVRAWQERQQKMRDGAAVFVTDQY